MRFLDKISNFTKKIKRKKLIFIYIPLTLIFVILSYFLFVNYESESYKKERKEAIDNGLKPMEIISVIDGKRQPINLSNTYNLLLINILSDEENTLSESEITSDLLSLIDIRDISMPILPEEYFKFEIITSKKSIEKYLTTVYNLYEQYPNDFDYKELVNYAKNNDFTKINQLLENNKNIYIKLLDMKIPKETKSIHKSYILSLQINNSLLLSMLKYQEDPLMVSFNNDIKNNLSPIISDTLRLNLDLIDKKYKINYRYN